MTRSACTQGELNTAMISWPAYPSHTSVEWLSTSAVIYLSDTLHSQRGWQVFCPFPSSQQSHVSTQVVSCPQGCGSTCSPWSHPPVSGLVSLLTLLLHSTFSAEPASNLLGRKWKKNPKQTSILLKFTFMGYINQKERYNVKYPFYFL